MRILRVAVFIGLSAVVLLLATTGEATEITYSGMVSYSGVYVADSLYVVVIDTTAGFALVDYDAIEVSSPPFNVPYSISFNNSTLEGPVLVAGILDVDGSGFDPELFPEVFTAGDILGWYPSQPIPVLLSGDVSDSGLSFWLPTGEIRGNVIFGQSHDDVEIEAISEDECGGESEWSPPIVEVLASGPYTIVGLYAGNWCVSARAFPGDTNLCYDQNVDCTSPTLVLVAADQVVTGIDLDFTITPTKSASWGVVKNLYR